MAGKNIDGSNTTMSCDRAVIVDTQLHIRHGSALMLLGLRWIAASQAVGESLLGRPFLKRLALDYQNVLATASDRLGGTMDVSYIVCDRSDFINARIGRVLDGVFHADGGTNDADLDEDDGWLDLRPEDKSENERVLKSILQEGKEHGLYDAVCKELDGMLAEFDHTIKIKLDGGTPAEIEPLRVSLKRDAMPGSAKQHRYPRPKRESMTRYVRELLKLGFVKNFTSSE